MQKFLKSIFSYSYPYSVHSLNDIKNCLYANHAKGTVYAGAQARLVRLTKSNPDHCAIYDWLAEEVYKYLNNEKTETQTSFDEWHHLICESFIEKCAAISITAKYGMAQKFLNILLKYVYCFDDADTLHPTKFEFCHIILDGYSYYSPYRSYSSSKTYGSYIIHTPFYSTDVACASSMRRTVWSKLSYEDYIQIQKEIRVHLDASPLIYDNVKALDVSHLATVSPTYKLTPFETEFFIW